MLFLDYFFFQFSLLLLCNMLNLYDLKFNETSTIVTEVSAVLSVIIIVTLLGVLLKIFVQVWCIIRGLLTDESIEKFN
jgi:hypothetical protein